MNSADFNAEVSGGLNNAELVNKDSFERLRSKNRRKEILRKVFYIFISLFLIAVLAVLCVVLFFDMKKIEIKGNEKYTEEELLSVCGFKDGENLFGIDFDEVEKQIMSEFSYVRGVTFKRVLPSTLVITVSEDVPMWYTEIYGDWFVLSRDFRIISRHQMKEEVELLGLPLTYIGLPDVDRAVTGNTLKFVKASNYNYLMSFLTELEEYKLFDSINSIDATDRYRMAFYAENGKYKISVGTSDNLEAKVRFVSKVIEEEFDATTIASIDVERLNSAVVLKRDELFQYP